MTEWGAIAADVLLALLAVAMLPAFVRLARGPDLTDRVVALDLITMIAVAISAVYATAYDAPVFLDVAILMALITFVALLVGLFSGNRRLWLSSATFFGIALVVGGAAGIVVLRAGINRAEQEITSGAALVSDASDAVQDAGHQVYVEAEEVAAEVGSQTVDRLEGKGVDENGCPKAGLFDDAAERFEHVTCLTVPDGDTAEIVYAFEDYWLADGSYFAVLSVDPATARGWLDGPAPWGTQWRAGPVEGPPGFVDFAARESDWEAASSDTDSLRYAVHDIDDGIGDPGNYSTGDLVAIDPDTGEVWFAYWDS